MLAVAKSPCCFSIWTQSLLPAALSGALTAFTFTGMTVLGVTFLCKPWAQSAALVSAWLWCFNLHHGDHLPLCLWALITVLATKLRLWQAFVPPTQKRMCVLTKKDACEDGERTWNVKFVCLSLLRMHIAVLVSLLELLVTWCIFQPGTLTLALTLT